MALLTLQDVRLGFGEPLLLDGVCLQVEEGDRLCLVGRNGCGKTTLLRLLEGALPPDGGEVVRRQNLSTALVPQEVPPGLAGPVFDLVASGAGDKARLLAEYHALSHRVSAAGGSGLLDRLAALQKSLEESGAWTLQAEVERALSRLRLDPEAEFATLSGGLRRRVLLARALVSAPDVLLLDEPTNHLDIDTIVWLEELLLKTVRTVVFVTHDRAFARRLANRVAELDRGRLYAFDCPYEEFTVRREDLLEAEIARRAVFDKRLAREEAWLRRGVKARRTRDEGRVKALLAMREERRQRKERLGSIRLRMQEAERSGKLVVEAEEAAFGYGGGAPLFRNLSTVVARGDRVGIIGPNGSGKTTLLRLLVGDLAPTEGRVVLGTNRQVLYFDQLRDQLDPERTVLENVGEGSDQVVVNGRPRHALGYLQDFLFPPERAMSPVKVLSGGERNRLLLAKLFTRPVNVLVMDEPTNDLDVETLDLLEQCLLDFSGTLLLVSHDRDFLDNVVTGTLVLKGDGVVREYVGGYDDWLRQDAAEGAARQQLEEPPVRRPDSPAGRKAVDGVRKLTYREARELETLPGRIEALEKEQGEIHATLSDPEFYRGAAGEAARLSERLAEIERELGFVLERWVELEEIKELAQRG